MATKLKIVEDIANAVPAPTVPDFDPAPTRKRHAGWTAEKQRKFIEHLSLTGNVGEACAVAGVASSSAYRLKHKVGAESFSRAWDAALRLSPTRLVAIGLDWAVNGRVERHYKNGELVMELLVSTARRQASTVVIVTHEPQIAAYADREIVVRARARSRESRRAGRLHRTRWRVGRGRLR